MTVFGVISDCFVLEASQLCGSAVANLVLGFKIPRMDACRSGVFEYPILYMIGTFQIYVKNPDTDLAPPGIVMLRQIHNYE